MLSTQIPGSNGAAATLLLTLAGAVSACGLGTWTAEPPAPTGGSGGSASTGGGRTSSASTGGQGSGGGSGAGGGDGGAAAKAPTLGPRALTAGFLLHVFPDTGDAAATAIESPAAPSVDRFAEAAPTGAFDLSASHVRFNGACPEGFTSSTVCLDVALAHALDHGLSNVFAQVVTLTGSATGALNYDPSELGLLPSRGLWKYTTAAAETPGVLALAPDNAGSRTWVFERGSSGDFNAFDLEVRVVASRGFSTYGFDYSQEPFHDACALGDNLGRKAAAIVTLPFPFALYEAVGGEARVDARGMITLGPAVPAPTAKSVALPSAAAPGATIFAFWDDLVFGGPTSAICAETLGAAPNRRFVVTWRGMDFPPGKDAGANLSFSAVLMEGSHEIHLAYGEMSGPTDRARGRGATVGVQDPSRAAATAQRGESSFKSGAAFAFVPIP